MDSVDEGDNFAVLSLLIEWNVSEETQMLFMESDMELSQFLSLDLTKLREYVLESKERLHVANKIFQYKKRLSLTNNSSDRPDDSTFTITEEQQSIPHPNLNVSQSSAKDCDNSFKANDSVGDSAISETTDNLSKENCLTSQTGNEETAENSDVGSSQATTPRTTPVRLQRILANNKFNDFDLGAYLKTSVLRSSVLAGISNGMLTAEYRRDLVHILAEYILSVTTSPSSNDFLIVKGKIKELLPNEPLDLYYVAPLTNGPHQSLARGMLFSKVRNEISKLIKKKVIESRRKRRKPLEDASDNEDNNEDEPPEITGLLVMLKRARELDAEVQANWTKTAEVRLNQLYNSARKEVRKRKSKAARENEAPDVVSNYLNTYKLLKQSTGHVLLQIDFKHRYPDQVDNLFSNWPTFLSNLQHLAKNSKIDDEVEKELLQMLNSDELQELDENNRDALLIQLLPSLCPPTARVIVGKDTFKPSTLESRNAFIAHTTVAAGLEPLMKSRVERMTKKKAPLQPYMIFVGPTRWDIEATYVVVDNIIFKADNVMKCIDICFKSFHGLCAGYPKEANHIWHIFHLHLYKIPHDSLLEGEVPMSTSNFLAKLNSLPTIASH